MGVLELMAQTWAEVVGAILGVLSVWLLARGNGHGWPVGLATVVFTGVVYWNEKIYGQMALCGIFFALQLVGWRRWAKGTERDMRLSSRRLAKKERMALLAFWLIATAVLAVALGQGGGRHVVLDAFATVASMLGQALIVAGFAECWLAYLAADVCLVVLSVQADLKFYVAMYLIYCCLARNGWRQWTSHDSGRP